MTNKQTSWWIIQKLITTETGMLSGTAININPYHNIYLYFAGILRYQVDFQILDPHLDDLFEDFDLDDY
jgi:hypothetical protein